MTSVLFAASFRAFFFVGMSIIWLLLLLVDIHRQLHASGAAPGPAED